MEAFAIVLSSLLLMGSPAGYLGDRLSQSALNSALYSAEILSVRLDNAPPHRLLQGKIEKLRLAARGIRLSSDFRIDQLEIETDPLDLDLSQPKNLFSLLEKPLQAGIQITLTEADINHWLRSPQIRDYLRQIDLSSLPPIAAAQLQRYHLINPRITFLPNRLRLEIQLQEQPTAPSRPLSTAPELTLAAESGFTIIKGWGLELVDPQITLNQKPIPPLVLNLIQQGVKQRVDLRTLQNHQIILRLLGMNLTPGQLKMAGFISLQPPFDPEDRPD